MGREARSVTTGLFLYPIGADEVAERCMTLSVKLDYDLAPYLALL